MLTVGVFWLFVLIALVFGIIFAIIGWRGGLFSGIRLLAFSVTAALLAFFISPLISKAVYHSQLLENTVISVTDKAAEMGISSQTFNSVMDSTIQRYLNMVIAPVLFILLLVIMGITWRIIKSNINRNKEQELIKMKSVGLLLGIAGAVFITLFSMFAPKINLFKEVERGKGLYELVEPIITEEGDYLKLLPDVPKLVDIYLNTQLIAASEEERLDLIYKTFMDLTMEEKYNYLSGIAASLNYTNGEAFENEIDGAVNVFTLLGDKFLSEMIEGNAVKALTYISDINTVVNDIYTLNMRDGIVQVFMTMIIRDISDNDTYIYPKTIEISGTQETFKELLEYLPGVNGDNEESMRNFNRIKNSPLIPPDDFYHFLGLLYN